MNALTKTSPAEFDLRKFEFPKVTDLDMAFPTFGTNPALLAEAEKRGFDRGNLPGNKMFSTLFFSGGRVNFRKDVPAEFQKDAWNYCRALMGSFSPSHEDKEAVCSMLLAEVAESVEAKT